MTLWQKFDEILQSGNFGVNFKTLISVALAIWGKIEATPHPMSKVLEMNFVSDSK